MRRCVDCGVSIDDMHAKAYLCPGCAKTRAVARSKAWYNTHADLTAARQLAWKRKNRERHNANNAAYRARHRREKAQFKVCQMPDCGRPLELYHVKWCRRCGPFVKRDRCDSWRQRHLNEVNARRRERRAA